MWLDPLILRSLPTGPREARPDDKLSKRLEGGGSGRASWFATALTRLLTMRVHELVRRLLAKLGHVVRHEFRSLCTEARGDIVGDGRDLVVAIGIAERRHRERA